MLKAKARTRATSGPGLFAVKLVGCAVAAAALPAAALLLAPAAQPATQWAALLGGLIAVALIAYLVAPLGALSAGLRRLREDLLGQAAPTEVPGANPADARGMLADTLEIAACLENVKDRLANKHPVTGLATREPFLARLAQDTAESESATVLAAVRFTDYDRLSAFDQASADCALAAFAERLKSSLPGSRPLAQIDRDGFALWFPGCPDTVSAFAELNALGYVLRQELTYGEHSLSPEVAIGASVFPEHGRSPGELLTRAIVAMGSRPGAGQSVSVFSSQSLSEARQRFALEQDLRGVVGRDQLVLHYQPIVDLGSGEVAGAEALMRWNHPEHGLLGPGSFIPVLEQSAAMSEVGLWALNAACREAATWRTQGLSQIKMAVNLSATQCRDPKLPETVLRTLSRNGLPPASLELELTETTAAEDIEHTRRLLGALRAQGISVSIDDFGAGHSNLTYLKNLPFSKLKIDREFVTDVHLRRDSRAICAALIELARGLEISVLAEGVETLEEVETLYGMGCRLFQGYFFARPMPGADFVRTVQDPAWRGLLASPVHRRLSRIVGNHSAQAAVG